MAGSMLLNVQFTTGCVVHWCSASKFYCSFLYNVEAFRPSIGLGAGERERNLIPTHADAEHIAEYLAEPLEVVPTSPICVPLRPRGAHAWHCRARVS